ncbi:hypothetical protein F4781DRAFT_51897 [Annulohypoxylon bovei var. microspora]|nr:hypothetical protein F4781DRAFT_51897 [Annulohypoxylon bovei var. microspora]
MGDPLGAAGSIIGIAAFGLKFATTLQTYIEAVADARESLRDIAFDVSATASALDQLHQLIKVDDNCKAIANDSGVQEAARLASKCKQVYTAVINLIAKAVGVLRDSDGEISIDALDAIDLNESTAVRLVQRLKWPFQEPRIRKHQEELRWLKISLLLHLRLMELAKTKMMAPAKSFSAREKEMALQANLAKLMSSKQAYATRIASERRRNKRIVRRKRGSTGTRSSASIEMKQSRSLSPKGKNPISRSPGTNGSRELSPSFTKGNNDFGVQNASTSKEPIDDVLTFSPLNQIPKPPQFKFKHPTNPTPNPMMFNNLLPRGDLFNTQEVGNSKAPGNNTGPSNPTRPISIFQHMANNPFTPSQTQHNMQIPTINTTNSHSGAQDNPPPINNNEDKEKGNSNGHTTEHPKNRHKLRFLRESFSLLPWTSHIFSKRGRNNFPHDHESQDLEAYLIEGDNFDPKSNPIRKLPFGHQQLTVMLKRVTKSQRGDVWTQYTSLTSAQRESVDRALLEAHRSSSRARTCVAISSGQPGGSHVVVFFSLGAPARPVHFRYNARYFQFAFELCRTWEGMASLIKPMLAIPNLDLLLQNGQLDLVGADDRLILPSTWSSAVHPGLSVSLVSKGFGLTAYQPRPLAFAPPQKERKRTALFGRGRRDVTEAIETHSPPSPPADSDAASVGDESTHMRAAGRQSTWQKALGYPQDVRGPPLFGQSGEWRLESAGLFGGGERGVDRIHPVVFGERGSAGEDEDEDTEDEEDEESDIIDFEEEEETARLGLEGLLGKWTNAVDASPDGEQHEG